MRSNPALPSNILTFTLSGSTFHSMNRSQQRPFWPVRVLIVAVFACLTICSGLTAARANVITAAHLIEGERMVPDGGWTSACNTAIENCTAQDNGSEPNEFYGLHHHHHVDCQFSALPAVPETADAWHHHDRAILPGYAAVIKAASPAAADQPPKI